MSVRGRFEKALKAHLGTLGREVPRWELVADKLIVRDTDEDVREIPIGWLDEHCEGLEGEALEAALQQTAKDLVFHLEAPDGAPHFVSDWFDQTSLIPLSQLKAVIPHVVARVAPELRVAVAMNEPNRRWLRQRLKLSTSQLDDERQVLDACARYMRERVAVEPVGPGAFKVQGHFCDVALMGIEDLVRLNGTPVVLRTGGIQLFVATAEDGPALVRILRAAEAWLAEGEGPRVPDAQLLRQDNGEWKQFAPPLREPEAREAYMGLARTAAQAQYAHQEQMLRARLPNVSFAAVDRLLGSSSGPTVTRWFEGKKALLPLTDAITLVPERGAGLLLPTTSLGQLIDLGCLAPLAFDEETALAPLRLETLRFPTAAELAALRKTPYQWDLLGASLPV